MSTSETTTESSTESSNKSPSIGELYSAQQIQERIVELGKIISRDYADLERPVGPFAF
jgi:hypoxanthine-guanine phosphoribosyltransferase